MFDKIVFISDRGATIKLKDSENITMNLMNLHLVFEDDTKKILGEVSSVNGDTLNASFLGEIVGDRFLGGTIRKPRLDARIRIINVDEIQLITGKDEVGFMRLGNTPFYEGASVFLDVNNFFSSHFAIFGNSGSGKSCGISRLFQNMFHDEKLNPANANIIMLDSSGEYYNAFSNLNSINHNFHYRFISTNKNASGSDELRIPIYLLNVDDLALLLQITNHSQLPIVERMRKLALVFSQKDVDANNYKNHLIAKAIMTILYTNETAPNKRNEVFSILASCSTPQFNLEAVVQGIGYTRKFRECFLIDNSGNFSESVLLTEYVSSFIDDDLDCYEPKESSFYTLDTLEKALNFTLISEGWLRNKNTYGDAVTLKVRLHSLIVGNNSSFFDVSDYMSVEQYLKALVNKNGKKCQFVNINLDDVDDSLAKVITKIFSRLIFDYSKSLTQRASNPFHIVIEEAHRYIQNDTDRFLLGYNIFERIAKEGRKYGVILGIITQRPVELSDTVISQCSNFMIFKMNHPVDVEYIRKMVPNISDEIVEKQKTLQAGTCLGFGSAFRIPMIVRMDMPNPAPWSGNCDVVSFWGGNNISNDVKVSVGDSELDDSFSANNSFVIENPVAIQEVIPPSAIEKASGVENLVKMNDGSFISINSNQSNLAENSNLQEHQVKTPIVNEGINLVTFSNPSSNSNNINENIALPTGAFGNSVVSSSLVSNNVESANINGNLINNVSEVGENSVSLVNFTGGGSITIPGSSNGTQTGDLNNMISSSQNLQNNYAVSQVTFNDINNKQNDNNVVNTSSYNGFMSNSTSALNDSSTMNNTFINPADNVVGLMNNSNSNVSTDVSSSVVNNDYTSGLTSSEAIANFIENMN